MGGAPAEEGGDGVNLCPAVPTHLVDIVVLGTDRFGYREREREREGGRDSKRDKRQAEGRYRAIESSFEA